MERISLAAEDDTQAGLPRRYEALAYIMERIVRYGSSPVYREIADRLDVSYSRAHQLVEQLIVEGRIIRVPGTQRNLRVVDMAESRLLLDQILRKLQWVVADPMGAMQTPLSTCQLPLMPEIRQLLDQI